MTFFAEVYDRKTNKIHAQAGPFGVAPDAWRWLRDERQRTEDENPAYEYSDTWVELDYLAFNEGSYGDPLHDYGYDPITGWGTRTDGTGLIVGETPALMNWMGESPCDDIGVCYAVITEG